jgi:PAS domain-containing protein
MNVERWQPLLDGMIEAVWLVDPLTLRIVAANRVAASMLNMESGELVGRPVIELAATPEDQFFWEDVAAGLTDNIFPIPCCYSRMAAPYRLNAGSARSGYRQISSSIWSPSPTRRSNVG